MAGRTIKPQARQQAPRQAIARLCGGLSYNFAAAAYVIPVAVAVSATLNYFFAAQSNPDAAMSVQSSAILGYTLQPSVLTMTIGLVIAFIAGALSLALLVWVPYKIALIGSRLAQKISSRIFSTPLTGAHMFTAKMLLYGPAVIVLIVLYLIFSSELMFQLMAAGTGLVLMAVMFAMLRVVISR